MAAAVPTTEPTEIYSGDSIHFTKSIRDYSAVTWALSYRLLSQKGAVDLDIAATASGADFDIAVTSGTTAAWTAGEYWLLGFLTSGTERVQTYKGVLSVLPNPATVDHFDGRTYLQRILAKLDEVIENGVIRETIRYSYGGVTTEVWNLNDALKARATIVSAIANEEALASGKQRRVLTRFLKPR